MSWSSETLQDLLTDLRIRGGDRTEVEVKRAAGGVPRVAETLCAFGNMPDGGTLLLGIDEKDDFTITGVTSVADVEAGVASQARTAVRPPVTVTFESALVDGMDVVIAVVQGLPVSDRPCVTKTGGHAYLRQADGDYRMSEQEVSQMLALRDRPRHDARPVAMTSVADLDPDLTARFIATARATSRRLADSTDDQVLRMKGVISHAGDGALSVAGLYALGRYPQQFTPSLSITAAVELPGGSEGRTRDLAHLDGPIPELLDSAMEWVRRNTRSVIRYGTDGHGIDESEIPMVAVRELIANALVHRDLSAHTQSKRVEIRLRDDRLVISNPGGLWGVSKDQLGTPAGKSAVNEFLYEICKLTRTASGRRVVEGEGGGIREVQTELRRAGMLPPTFHDKGVQLTVIVPRHALLAPEDLAWLADTVGDTPMSDMQRQILVSMRRGQQWTNAFVRREFAPIDSTEARAALQGLVTAGFAEVHGDRGSTTYHLASRLDTASEHIAPAVQIRSAQDDPETAIRAARSSRNGALIWEALRTPRRIGQMVEQTGLKRHQVAYSIQKLVEAGLVTVDGGRGDRLTRYRRR